MVVERQYVLSKLRGLAEENGGKPPGRVRFTRATGIPEAAWLGRYWTRWSDALREAGFEPNQWQQAIDDEELFEALGLLVRDLAKWPTGAELKMRHITVPEFPSVNTFSRFGGRAKLAALTMEHATGRGWQDVVAICGPVAADASADSDGETAGDLGREPRVAGSVYLMRSGRYYKLGRSNAVGRRMYELRIQLPERLELVHSFETDDPAGIERYWHNRFAAKRSNGEWFSLGPDDVAAFKRRRSYM